MPRYAAVTPQGVDRSLGGPKYARPLPPVMRTTRRAFLAGAGTALGGVAGCLGGASGSGPSAPDVQNPQGVNGCTLREEEPVEQLPTPAIGDPDAGVTVKAWEDYACPHCATYVLEVLPKLRSEYVEPGKIRYEHHDFPIPMSDWSWWAASAARGVQDRKDVQTFYDYSHDLFANQDSYSKELVTELANQVGAPGCEIQSDAVYTTYEPVLQADRRAGEQAGVSGTPAVFVNGESVEPSYEAVSSAIDSAL